MSFHSRTLPKTHQHHHYHHHFCHHYPQNCHHYPHGHHHHIYWGVTWPLSGPLAQVPWFAQVEGRHEEREPWAIY